MDKWDQLFNSEACQKIYPMHTVLLVKLFDTENKLFVFYQRESKLFVFFSRSNKILWWYFLELFRQKLFLNYYFDNQCNVYNYVDTNCFLDQSFNANDVDNGIWTLCLIPPATAWSDKCFSQSQYKVFFLQIVKSTFVIFTSIFGRPAHQTPAYIIFFQSAKFRLLWLVDQLKCGIRDWSILSCWDEFKLQFQVQFVLNIYPVQ